jgi:hypothetical protein
MLGDGESSAREEIKPGLRIVVGNAWRPSPVETKYDPAAREKSMSKAWFNPGVS